ncbi:hypothetical protein HYH03_013430 [Edaphochlamys debaryana]|uniref:Protein kinase domain-containing protein n=1 Tax=Edaphochlamys debaryana TaxID=47281 RepID=A0A836BSY6_9CHLO|nr:hypothetical protein HYH03_013430 [Edaphochlamys debaryana]|eukprot:KAG2487991.1 hypothetical protein HYH03_013430 [Edaphochlamys debaryana]
MRARARSAPAASWLCLAVAVLVCSSAEARVLNVSSAVELVRAFRDNDVAQVVLTADVQLRSDDWPAYAVPINRTSNFTILGAALDTENQAAWPVLDFSFAAGKLRLARGVALTFSRITVVHFRDFPLFAAPGIDLLSADVAPNTDAAAPSWAYLILDTARLINLACLAPSLHNEYTLTAPRPPAVPGEQLYAANIAQLPGCSTAPDAPEQARCYPLSHLYIQYATYGTSVGLIPHAVDYLLVVLNTRMDCRVVLDSACVATLGSIGCFYSIYPRNEDPRNASSSTGGTGGSSNSTSGGIGGLGGNSSVGGLALPPSAPPPGGPGARAPLGAAEEGGQGEDGAPVGAIVGGVLGGVVAVALIAGLAWAVWAHRRRRRGGAQQPLIGARKRPDETSGSAGAGVAREPSQSHQGNGVLRPSSSLSHAASLFRPPSNAGPVARVASQLSLPREALQSMDVVVTTHTPMDPDLVLDVRMGTADDCTTAAALAAAALAAAGGSTAPGTATTYTGAPPSSSHAGGGSTETAGPDSAGPNATSSNGREGGGEVTLLPLVLGKGAFGRVQQGLWNGQRVAVKLLNLGMGAEDGAQGKPGERRTPPGGARGAAAAGGGGGGGGGGTEAAAAAGGAAAWGAGPWAAGQQQGAGARAAGGGAPAGPSGASDGSPEGPSTVPSWLQGDHALMHFTPVDSALGTGTTMVSPPPLGHVLARAAPAAAYARGAADSATAAGSKPAAGRAYHPVTADVGGTAGAGAGLGLGLESNGEGTRATPSWLEVPTDVGASSLFSPAAPGPGGAGARAGAGAWTAAEPLPRAAAAIPELGEPGAEPSAAGPGQGPEAAVAAKEGPGGGGGKGPRRGAHSAGAAVSNGHHVPGGPPAPAPTAARQAATDGGGGGGCGNGSAGTQAPTASGARVDGEGVPGVGLGSVPAAPRAAGPASEPGAAGEASGLCTNDMQAMQTFRLGDTIHMDAFASATAAATATAAAAAAAAASGASGPATPGVPSGQSRALPAAAVPRQSAAQLAAAGASSGFMVSPNGNGEPSTSFAEPYPIAPDLMPSTLGEPAGLMLGEEGPGASACETAFAVLLRHTVPLEPLIRASGAGGAGLASDAHTRSIARSIAMLTNNNAQSLSIEMGEAAFAAVERPSAENPATGIYLGQSSEALVPRRPPAAPMPRLPGAALAEGPKGEPYARGEAEPDLGGAEAWEHGFPQGGAEAAGAGGAAAGAAAGAREAKPAGGGGREASLYATFVAEVEVMARMRHPNIIRLLAASLQPPRVCLVMELAETSLDRLLYGRGPGAGPLPLGTVLHIGVQICSALAYMHPTVIHRDLKPANVLLMDAASPTPTVKLADFGLSKLQSTAQFTRHAGVGTASYMAPETLSPYGLAVTHHVDIYATGIILFEMLAGQHPWRGLTIIQIATAVALRHQRPDLDALGSERCPPRLRQLIRACWEADPLRRPAAPEMAKTLVLLQNELALLTGAPRFDGVSISPQPSWGSTLPPPAGP